MGSTDNHRQNVRTSIEDLRKSINILSQADFILEEKITSYENSTDILVKEMNKVWSSAVSTSDFMTVMANISGELSSIRTHNDMNITTLAFSVKALEQKACPDLSG